MPIVYSKDILSELKHAGYTTYKLRTDKILSESTIQKLRRGDLVSLENISIVCRLLCCQPGDLLNYVPDEYPIDD